MGSVFRSRHFPLNAKNGRHWAVCPKGVRAAADEVHRLQVLEAVAGPQMQELIQGMRQVERRPPEDLHVLLPALRREDLLVADALLDVAQAHALQLAERHGPEPALLTIPVHVGMLVGHRNQDVEGGHPRRRHAGVGDRGIVDVEGRVLAQAVALLDVPQVPAV